MLKARAGQQAQIRLKQGIQQTVLNHPILHDMAEHLGMHAGRRKVHLARAGAVPHLHIAIRAGAPRGDPLPSTEAFEDALAGRRQGADPGFKRRRRSKGLNAQRAAVQQQNL